MKKCSKCKETKDLAEFNKTKTNKDGLSYLCKECNRLSNKVYRKRNQKRYYENQRQKRETEPVFLSQLMYNCKTRAGKKGIEFNLDLDFIQELFKATKGKCSLTQQNMNLECHSRKKANPFKASLDRIDSTKGYIKGNVRFVCWAVNQMKADRTDEEFKFWVETIYKAISSQA